MSLGVLLEKRQHELRLQRYDAFGGVRYGIKAVLKVDRTRECGRMDFKFRFEADDCAINGLEGDGEFFNRDRDGKISKRGYFRLRGFNGNRHLSYNMVLNFQDLPSREGVVLTLRGLYGGAFEADLGRLDEFTLTKTVQDEEPCIQHISMLAARRQPPLGDGGSGGEDNQAMPKQTQTGTVVTGTSTTSYPDV